MFEYFIVGLLAGTFVTGVAALRLHVKALNEVEAENNELISYMTTGQYGLGGHEHQWDIMTTGRGFVHYERCVYPTCNEVRLRKGATVG